MCRGEVRVMTIFLYTLRKKKIKTLKEKIRIRIYAYIYKKILLLKI